MAVKFKDFLSVDYTGTKDGQLAKNAKKRKKDSGEGTTEDCLLYTSPSPRD